MNPNEIAAEDYRRAFHTLAELVNQLPDEERRAVRQQLGVYSHDLKHTLGLIIGANGILQRLDPAAESGQDFREMTEIIRNAAFQIDSLVMQLVEDLNNRIEQA